MLACKYDDQVQHQLYRTSIAGLVSHAPTSESVKCQAVVNALNSQLPPNCTLDHIRGEELARPNITAIML